MIVLKELNIRDFKQASLSPFTKGTKKARKILLGGSEIKHLKFHKIRISRKKDNVEFIFLSTVTPDGKKKSRTDETDNFKLVNNPSGTYVVRLRIEKFFSWLSTQPKGLKITDRTVKEVLEVSDVKMWSNDPSLYWQGLAYNLTQLDASLYPVTIKPKVWNKILGGEYFLSKHLAVLVNNIEFFFNPMAKMVASGLNKLGMLNDKGELK